MVFMTALAEKGGHQAQQTPQPALNLASNTKY
jgi:hypothetical protein